MRSAEFWREMAPAYAFAAVMAVPIEVFMGKPVSGVVLAVVFATASVVAWKLSRVLP